MLCAEENDHRACADEHLTPANQSEIRKAYLVSGVQNESEGGVSLYYELYIDSLFCTDFIMNFYVLSLTSKFCGRTATRPRKLLGAAYGAGIYCTIFFLPGGWLPFKIFAGMAVSAVGMIWIAFGRKKLSVMLKLLATMIGAAFFQGGIFLFVRNQISFIGESDSTVILTLIIGAASYRIGCFLIEKNRKKEQLFCRVKLQNGEKEIQVNALLDTGNFLVEPLSGKAVSVLEETVLLELFGGVLPQYYRVVPYSSIGKQKGILKCFEIPKMWMEYQEENRAFENVLIACNSELPLKGGCPMILNPKLINNQEEGK